MRRNKKRKALLHSAMRANRRDDGTNGKIVLGVVATVLAVALAVGAAFGYSRLRELWIEQCVLDDVARQVTINTGSHVKEGVILDGFGLRKGANLALIDFKAKRAELLEKIPNIRTLDVERHLPDRVEITVSEREPAARLGLRGQRSPSGRVVDADGVVFMRRTGTDMLPTIREARAPGVAPGKRLSGRLRAALDLVMLCQDQTFSTPGILEVDVSSQDYLLAVLGNYQRAKIAWEGMDEPTAASHDRLVQTVSDLRDAINTSIAARAVIWNATQPGRPTADTKEPIL